MDCGGEIPQRVEMGHVGKWLTLEKHGCLVSVDGPDSPLTLNAINAINSRGMMARQEFYVIESAYWTGRESNHAHAHAHARVPLPFNEKMFTG